MNLVYWLGTLAFVFSLSAQAQGAEETQVSAELTALEAQLRGVLEENVRAANAEDAVGYLLTLHFESPVYGVTQDVLTPQFETYDFAYKLLDFHLLSLDGEYAVGRGSQQIVKLRGPAFEDSTTDALYVFRQEAGAWKLWQQSPLETRYP